MKKTTKACLNGIQICKHLRRPALPALLELPLTIKRHPQVTKKEGHKDVQGLQSISTRAYHDPKHHRQLRKCRKSNRDYKNSSDHKAGDRKTRGCKIGRQQQKQN